MRTRSMQKEFESISIKRHVFIDLSRIRSEITEAVGKTAFWSDVISLLIEAWRLLPDEEREEIIANYRRRRLGKGEGVPIPGEALAPQ